MMAVAAMATLALAVLLHLHALVLGTWRRRQLASRSLERTAASALLCASRAVASTVVTVATTATTMAVPTTARVLPATLL